MDAHAVILLIAPEDAWTRDLTDHLTARSIEVVWRPDTLAGIEAAQHQPPHAVVVDERCQVLRPNEIGKLLKSKLPYTALVLLGSAKTPLAMECLEAANYDLMIHRESDLAFVASQLRALCRTHDLIDSLVTSNRRLIRLSMTDQMTGLYNHKRLLDWLEIEFKRAERSLEPLSCIMIDLDHFKMINDTYGHKFGDHVLQEFASLLRANIRKTDILGRYGGEEFLVILPNTDAVGAVNLGEKLRRSTEEFGIDQDNQRIRITASFGIASTSDGQVFNHDQLLQMTDKALYVAKSSGRNRVCSLTEIAPGPDLAVEPLSRLQRPMRAAPAALIYVEKRTPPDETLMGLVEKSGFQPGCVSDVRKLIDRSQQGDADVILLDPNLTDKERETVVEQLRGKSEGALPSIVAMVPEENEETEQLRQTLGVGGEVVAVGDIEHVLAPVLRALFRLKILRDEVRDTQGRLRAIQKKLVRSERLKALGEIASGVAHDFNNALGIILGRSQMLRDRSKDPELRKGLVLIERAAQDVATSVKRILDFFRPEAKGKFQPHYLDNLIQECLEVTKVRWKDEAHLQGIRYEITTQIPRGLRVLGNDSELAEVFNNLLFNALDAMPEGGKLEIRAEENEDMVEIVFQDTGVGMPPEVLDKIFDPFFSTRSDKGTGLGLSLVRGTILRHHGEIAVESEPDEGTTFRIRLPISDTDVEIEPILPEEVKPPRPKAIKGGAALQVLVVDDEPELLAMFAEILSERGYGVTTAPNGPDALAEMGKHRYDVLITDLGMPEMSGWDLIREARKLAPSARYILTTGWTDSSIDVDLQERGVDHVLPKPVEVQSLIDLMDHISASIDAQNQSGRADTPG